MTPTLAQVLSTLAHEIRTPLAVSRGYLRLLLDGGLPSAADQHAALERTREALGAISALCEEMGMVASVAAIEPSRAVGGRLSARGLAEALTAALAADAPEWRGSVDVNRAVATHGTDDLVRAIAALARMAFADAAEARRIVQARTSDEALALAIGGEEATGRLPHHPGADGAAEVTVARGGFGLSLMWAAFVLDRHHVRTWHRANDRGAVGFLLPLVNP